KEVVIYYDGHEVGKHRLDLLVEGQIILELKTVEALSTISLLTHWRRPAMRRT
ncbi:MAG: hypothetical protein KFH98_13755, partial [Gemmatimonadetes bacterium]|nr:hypothetical protein [Gemmatimonadota bacterium]